MFIIVTTSFLPSIGAAFVLFLHRTVLAKGVPNDRSARKTFI